jgi:hypothetical protein
MKICSRCGNNLTWNRSFCPLCGGFLVEKPDEYVSDHHREQAVHTARQESAHIQQPQPTAPLNENMPNMQPEVPEIPDSPIEPIAPVAPTLPEAENLPDLELLRYQPEDSQAPSELQSWTREIPRPETTAQDGVPGEDFVNPIFSEITSAEPEPPLESNAAQQTVSAPSQADFPPLGDTFPNRTDLPSAPSIESKPNDTFTPPAETNTLKDLFAPLDSKPTPPLPVVQNEAPDPLADFPPQQTPAAAMSTADNAVQPVKTPIEQSAQEPFLGIMKGSGSGRAELTPPKSKDSASQQTTGAFEKLSAPEEIKQRSDVPNMDMFSRKRGEGFMPSGNTLKPQDGLSSETAQPPEPQAQPVSQAPQPPRVVGFTLPVHEPPKTTATQAASVSGTLSQPSPTLPQQPVIPVPIQPPLGAGPQPAATVPIQPPIPPVPEQQTIFTQPSTPITPLPTTETTPPVMPLPIPVLEVPLPPALPTQLTSIQPTAPTLEAPLPPALPLLTPTRAVTPTPTPEAPLQPVLPIQLTPMTTTPPVTPTPPASQADSAPFPIPTAPTGQAEQTPSTPPAAVQPQAAPGTPQASQYSKFAEFIPRSQMHSEEAGQALPVSAPPKAVIPQEPEKKAEDSFPQLPMGEFLKMFPEARPE